jgi:ABC-type multidrug transport system ATPase subunit
MSGIAAADARRRIPELLERVRLSEWADVRVKKFSKGMTSGWLAARRREPDVLLLDSRPTASIRSAAAKSTTS